MPPRNFVCSQCKAIFTSKAKHQAHVKMHEEKAVTREGDNTTREETNETPSLNMPGKANNEIDSNKPANNVQPTTSKLKHEENCVDSNKTLEQNQLEKPTNNVPVVQRKVKRMFKCQKCDQIFGALSTLKKHEVLCKVATAVNAHKEGEVSSEEDLDDIEGDVDYIEGQEGRSQISRIAELQSIIDKGSSEPVKMKTFMKNLGITKAKKRPPKKPKDTAAAPKVEKNNENQNGEEKKKKTPTKRKKKKAAEESQVNSVETPQGTPVADVHLCTKCEMKFPSPEMLFLHMKSHHVPKSPTREFQCFVCKMF